MKAPAIIASVTIACSLGFAAGQGRPAMPSQDMATPPVPPKDSTARGGSGSQGGVAMQVGGADDCAVIGPSNWMFSTARLLPECYGASLGDIGIIARGRMAVDLDGDGDEERIIAAHKTSEWDYQTNTMRCVTRYQDYGDGAGCFVNGDGGGDWGHSVLWVETTTWTGNTVAIVQQAILEGARTYSLSWLLNGENPGWDYQIRTWKLLDFRDIDDDGDLDLIVKIAGYRYQDGYPEQAFTAYGWLENTSAFNTSGGADVNRDGVVNGQDLAYVLSAWTP